VRDDLGLLNIQKIILPLYSHVPNKLNLCLMGFHRIFKSTDGFVILNVALNSKCVHYGFGICALVSKLPTCMMSILWIRAILFLFVKGSQASIIMSTE
jgi:hypothetical protein